MLIDNLPMVSVIMPIRNEASYIRRSLGSVLAQDYPSDRLEVLIVDGMSDDETRTVIAEILEHYNTTLSQLNDCNHGVPVEQLPAVRVLDNPAHFVSFALNIGLSQATGSVVTLVGGHCEISRDYLRRSVEALQETGAYCTGGVMTTVGETFGARAIALAQSSRFGVGGVAFRTGRSRPGYVDTVVFGSYRREVFDYLGGFDEGLVRNQDDEFNYRVAHAGGRIWFDGRITCTYYSRASLSRLWRQYFEYGFWKVRVLQKHPFQMRVRQFVPPVFVALVLLSALVATVLPAARYFEVGLLAVYSMALFTASVLIARRSGWRNGLLMPVAFVALHCGYGLGFLWGLLKFWNRWGRPRGHQSAHRLHLSALRNHH